MQLMWMCTVPNHCVLRIDLQTIVTSNQTRIAYAVKSLHTAERHYSLLTHGPQADNTTCLPCNSTPSMRSSFTRRMAFMLVASGGEPCSAAAAAQCCLTCLASCFSGTFCPSDCTTGAAAGSDAATSRISRTCVM